MKVIVFAKTKGGVSASTLCFNLGIYASINSKVYLIDRDPQRTLEQAWYRRGGDLFNPRLITDIKSGVAPAIKNYVDSGFDRDYAFVDTPGSNMPIITDAISAADLVVVPTQVGFWDLWAQSAVLERANKLSLQSKVVFVLTRTQTKGGKSAAAEIDEAQRYLRQFSPHPIATMPDRVDYRRASKEGKAGWEISKDSQTKEEIGRIWEVLQSVLKAQSCKEQSNVIPLAS